MAKQYTDGAAFVLPRPILYKNGVNIETITADKNLTSKDSLYQVLTNNKGSVATIKTPAKRNGLILYIKNAAASGNELYIQDIDGVDIIGSPYLAAGKCCILVCDGSSWAVLFEQA